jgi:hypothetical protein
MLDGTSSDQLDRLVSVENVLQKRSPSTRKRKATLIRKRFSLVDRDLLKVIVEGSRTAMVQCLLISAIKHSKLLGDFLQCVVKPKWRQFDTQLNPADWEEFLLLCEQADPNVTKWYRSTRAKLGQVVRTCLIEAGYLETARNPTIVPVTLTPEVRNYLLRKNDSYTLESMDILA